MILVACISCGPITINFRDGCYDLLLIYYNTITGRDQFGTKTSKITNHQYQSGPRLQKSQITSTNSGPTPTFIAKMTYFRFGTGNFGTGTAMSDLITCYGKRSPSYDRRKFLGISDPNIADRASHGGQIPRRLLE